MNIVQIEDYPKSLLLSQEFFSRETKLVALESLGKTLVRITEHGLLVAKIVETEAYLGESDPAAHASFGRTKRTNVLYGEPGHAYVYQLHGHHCLNFVVEPSGTPGCVLIRALEPLEGLDVMRRLRGKDESELINIANGPGKLCKAMGIDMAMYGTNLVDPASPLQVWKPLIEEQAQEVAISRRRGITKAADWELRFTLKGNPYVSK